MKSFFEQVVFDVGSSIGTELVETPVIGRIFHFHPEIELTCVERGSGWRFVGERIEAFGDGDLTLLGPMLPHLFVSHRQDGKDPARSVRTGEHPRVRVVKFARNFGLREEIGLPEFAAIGALLKDGAVGVAFPAEAAKKAAPKIRKIFETSGLKRLVILLEMLDELARSSYRRLDSGQLALGEADIRIHRVLGFIGGRLEKGTAPSLAETAAFACLSPESFSRYFRQKTRKSFIEYVAELKIGKALRLLRETDWSIGEIACRCGFGNLSNFNRHFRNMNRLTPREFRKLAKR